MKADKYNELTIMEKAAITYAFHNNVKYAKEIYSICHDVSHLTPDSLRTMAANWRRRPEVNEVPTEATQGRVGHIRLVYMPKICYICIGFCPLFCPPFIA